LCSRRTDFTYDADSNVTLTANRLRFDNDSTGSTGALGSPTSGVGARIYLRRELLRPCQPPNRSGERRHERRFRLQPALARCPPRSDTVLATHTDYDGAGNAYKNHRPPRHRQPSRRRHAPSQDPWKTTAPAEAPPPAKSVTNYNLHRRREYPDDDRDVPGTSTPSQTTAYVRAWAGTIGTDLFSNVLIAKVE